MRQRIISWSTMLCFNLYTLVLRALRKCQLRMQQMQEFRVILVRISRPDPLARPVYQSSQLRSPYHCPSPD